MRRSELDIIAWLRSFGAGDSPIAKLADAWEAGRDGDPAAALAALRAAKFTTPGNVASVRRLIASIEARKAG